MRYLRGETTIVRECSHVDCGRDGCQVPGLGPHLPRFMVDRLDRLWSRFGDTWYLYADGPGRGEILDCCTWSWLTRKHGPVTVDMRLVPQAPHV